MKKVICVFSLSLLTFYNSFVLYDYEIEDLYFLMPNYLLTIYLLLAIFVPSKYDFSFNDVFYVFYFFFFGVAPVFQYLEGVNIWGGVAFTLEDYILTTYVSLFAIVLYTILNRFFRKIVRQKRKDYGQLVLSNRVRINPWMLLLISFISFCVYFASIDFNIFKLLIRGGDEIESGTNLSTSSYLIVSKFIRPMSVASLILFKVCKCKNRIVEILLWIITLLANCPFGMARFSVAAFYIPLLFLYSRWIKGKYNFSIFLIFSILIIFPFLNQFRYFGDSDIKLGLDFDMFLAGHFDSFQMFMRVLKENIITYGNQLLGVIFFFMPRSLWPDKPIGSGHFVAGESDLYFDNISMNFFGEGYLNFGFLGVFLFVIVIAYFNAYMDVRFWENKNNNRFVVYYYLLLGMEFVILRGQLMSFYPIAVGYVLSAYIVYRLSIRNIH